MLLEDKIFIKVNPKNYKNLLNYKFNKIGDIIEIDICDLSKNSHINVKCECDICGFQKEIQYKSYLSSISKYNYYACSSKCSIKKSELTNLKKLGVKYPSQDKTVRNKYKNTMFDRYGVDNSLKIEGVNERAIENSKNSIAKYKRRITNLKIFGKDNVSKSDIFFKNTKIGKDKYFIKYLGDNICLFKCDFHDFEISTTNYHNRIKEGIKLCTICNQIGDSKSIKEKELFEFISDNFDGKIIQSYRDNLEIDIYIPEMKIGFEFNGLYWHSNQFKSRNYHLNKTNWFRKRGIRIIHIWEDDWTFKNDIIKSQIKNLLGKSKSIFARKCYIKELTNVTDFLNKNHIQGVDKSNIKLGLFFNEELISLMTFNKFEGRNMMNGNSWNISRFCNKLNINVVGGASKLLSYFEKKYTVSRLISYADKDWSIGNLYLKLGFKNIGENGPDYKYVIDNKRIHKSRYKKSNLGLDHSITESRFMRDKGIYKIYDCGKIKMEKKI